MYCEYFTVYLRYNQKLKNMFQYKQPKTDTDIKCDSDCMIRAVANATGEPYTKVHEIMYKHGWRATRRKSKGNFEQQVTDTLDELGFAYIRNSYPAIKGRPRRTAKTMPIEGTFIIRVAKHLSCVKEGIMLDTWDCSDKCVYFAWRIWKK